MKMIDFYLNIFRFFFLTFLCYLAWFLFTLDLSFFNLLYGFSFSLIITGFSYRFFYEKHYYYRSDFLIRLDLFIVFFFLLLYESYLSAFELAKLMFSGNYKPGVVRIKTRIRSRLGKMFLANFISAIPGTLSLWMENDYVFVHWFDIKTENSKKAGYLIKDKIEKLLMRIFG